MVFGLSAIAAGAYCNFSGIVAPLLFHLDQDPEVAMLAAPYLRIMGWGVIPMLLFMSLKQFTDGLEFTKTAMIMSILAIPVKVFLNWLIIFGNWGFPRWELYGAGVATLITRILLFLGLLWVIFRHSLFRRYIITVSGHGFSGGAPSGNYYT